MSRQINEADPKPFGDLLAVPVRDAAPVEVVGGIASLANGNTSGHSGASDIDGAAGPYDLSAAGDDALNVFFSEDNGVSYKQISLTGIDGAAQAAVTAAEVAADLNANDTFAHFFLASDNGGALRINPLTPSSLFKTYFTGGAAAQFGSGIAVAAAPGSAVAGANQIGIAIEFQATDQAGNPLAGADVYLSVLDGTPTGSAIVAASLGLYTKGSLIEDAVGGNDGVHVKTDGEGKVAFSAMHEGAVAAAYVTARPGSNTAALAISNEGVKQVQFT